jgi:hypothetical protein
LSGAVLLPALVVACQKFGFGSAAKAVGLTAVGTGAVVLAVVFEHRVGFTAFRETIYPGSRRSTAQALDLGILLGAPHLGVLKTTETFVGTNASEVSTGLTVLAIPCIFYGISRIDQWRTRLTPAWWALAAAFAILVVWVSIEIPTAIGERLPVISLIPPTRAAEVVGIGITAWFGVTIALLRRETYATRVRLAAVSSAAVGVLTANAGSVLRLQHIPDLGERQVLLNAALIAGCVGIAIACAHRAWALAPLTAMVLVIAIGVNPIMVGLGDLRSSAAARQIRDLHAREPGLWVTDSQYTDGLLAANAIPALSGEQFGGPNDNAWRRLDPTGAAEEQWNRGVAFLVFAFDPGATAPQIVAPTPDLISVVVNPCDVALRSFDVRVIVSSNRIDAPCLERQGTFAWAGSEHVVYTLKAAS